MRSDSNKALGALRVFDQGAFVRVTASETFVSAWRQAWPCFGPARPFSFTFDKRNGDLVDYASRAGRRTESNDECGIAALADDCRDFAFAKLNLFNPHKPAAKESAALTA